MCKLSRAGLLLAEVALAVPLLAQDAVVERSRDVAQIVDSTMIETGTVTELVVTATTDNSGSCPMVKLLALTTGRGSTYGYYPASVITRWADAADALIADSMATPPPGERDQKRLRSIGGWESFSASRFQTSDGSNFDVSLADPYGAGIEVLHLNPTQFKALAQNLREAVKAASGFATKPTARMCRE
jgi:hypothetical protein